LKTIDALYTYSSNVPWNNVLGISRTLLALGTFLTLLSNDINILFISSNEILSTPHGCLNFSGININLFCLFGGNLGASKILSLAILTSVISGFMPRLTCILHWWVSYSYANSATLIDGGDHITAILTLLLIPILLTDNRTWHWNNAKISRLYERHFSIIAQITFVVVKIQVMVIYLHAAIAKLSVPEWRNGTAVYYWWTHPTYGAADWLRPFLNLFVHNEFLIPVLTWGSIGLELLLFAAVFMDYKNRMIFLILGLVFHFVILMVHGLFGFFFAMAAALVLYLATPDLKINFRSVFRLNKI